MIDEAFHYESKHFDAFEEDLVPLRILRAQASQLITHANHNPKINQEYCSLVSEFLEKGGSKSDLIVKIAESQFGFVVHGGMNDRSAQGPNLDPPVSGSQRVSFEFLTSFMINAFTAVGVPLDDARLASDVLIEADKRGIDSHGIGRLKQIYLDRILNGILLPRTTFQVLKETHTTAFIDGGMGLGLVIGPKCMEIAIKKAKEFGLGFVVVQNSTHYGIAGYYATMATSMGCIGFTGTNARPSIAPTFGVEPCLGTNPLTFGIPTDEEFPFVIDCATSINQRGKIEKYDRLGMDTPRGMVIDHEGHERTDTHAILSELVRGTCALTPLGGVGDALGGYKGYGWATVVELLSTAFQSGPFGPALSGVDPVTRRPAPMPLGHFFLAIDVESLVDLSTFQRNAGNLLRYLRGSQKDPLGPGRIWTAGEPEWDMRKSRSEAHGTMIPPPLLEEMKQIRDQLPGMKEIYPKMNFETEML